MTIQQARRCLAKAGIELNSVRRRLTDQGPETVFRVITPVGTAMEFKPNEMIGLLRELQHGSSTRR